MGDGRLGVSGTRTGREQGGQRPALVVASGFPPYQVSRWLGHASVVTTGTIYSHLYPTDYAQHIARFERYANVAGPK